MDNEWYYEGHPIKDEALEGYNSFVYVIHDLDLAKSYFGKKRLHFVRRKKRVGRKNRVRTVRPSDWRDYWGSNDKLQERVRLVGVGRFERHILRLCRTLSESNYYELKYQMENDVLLHPERYYNEYVGSRISRRQMGVKDDAKSDT